MHLSWPLDQVAVQRRILNQDVCESSFSSKLTVYCNFINNYFNLFSNTVLFIVKGRFEHKTITMAVIRVAYCSSRSNEFFAL